MYEIAPAGIIVAKMWNIFNPLHPPMAPCFLGSLQYKWGMG